MFRKMYALFHNSGDDYYNLYTGWCSIEKRVNQLILGFDISLYIYKSHIKFCVMDLAGGGGGGGVE